MPSRSRRWRSAIPLLCALTCVFAMFPGSASASSRTVDGAPTYYDSGLARTPYLGWNTYYGLGAPSEDKIKSVADYLVSSGLRNAGYDIVWIDGGWTAPQPRDAQGNLLADPAKFPHGLPALVSYLHGHGLRAGIYTDAGASDGEELRGRQPWILRAGHKTVRQLEIRRHQDRLSLRYRTEPEAGGGFRPIQRGNRGCWPTNDPERLQSGHK